MPRIQGLNETGNVTGSQIIKDAEGYVFDVVLAWTGATAGALVYLRDGNTGASPIEVPIVLEVAAGTLHLNNPQGWRFATGIYYDEGSTVNVNAAIQYK